MVERQGKDYVGADFTGVERAVEAAQFDRMIALEEAVEIAKIMYSYT